LWIDIPENSDLRDVADLYGILIWSTEDNGSQIIKTAEEWLAECNDYRKVHVSMHLDIYPFRTPKEMAKAFEKVMQTFPNLKATCKELIESRGNNT